MTKTTEEKQSVSDPAPEEVNLDSVLVSLDTQLKELTNVMERQTSKRHALLLGVLRGVGTAVGATIVAALLFWLLRNAIDTVEEIPFIGDIIESIEDAAPERAAP